LCRIAAVDPKVESSAVKILLGGSSSSSQKKKDLRDSLHASYGAWQCPLTSSTGGIQGARQVPHSCAAAMMHAPTSPTHVSCSNRSLSTHQLSLARYTILFLQGYYF